MFGLSGDELNLINSQVDIDNEKNIDKKGVCSPKGICKYIISKLILMEIITHRFY